MRTFGVDLASADERTAGCIVDWTESGSVSILRFLDAPSLNALLADAGLAVEEQYG